MRRQGAATATDSTTAANKEMKTMIWINESIDANVSITLLAHGDEIVGDHVGEPYHISYGPSGQIVGPELRLLADI